MKSKHSIGKLYDKNSGHTFDAKRANEIWDMLYVLAQEGNLEVLIR